MRSRLHFLTFTVIGILLLFTCTKPVHATVMTNKKIINIIYDNSGSMDGNNKWAYANYSLQTLVSLMNSEDELYITYMDKPESSQKVDLNHVEDAVKGVVSKVDDQGATPYESLDTALKSLKSIPADNKETQYWMVVLTDGAFYPDYGKAEKKVPQKVLQNKLYSLSRESMPNGSSLRVKYMGIGTDANTIKNQGENLTGTKAKNEKEITDTLGRIADQISGRLRVKPSDIQKIDDYTVEIRSDLPLYSISTLSQGSQAKVTSALAGKTSLNIDRNIVLKKPDSKHWTTTAPAPKGLKGNASVINNKDKTIPAGKYRIKFSEKIRPENLAVMYEPAIDLKIDAALSGAGKKVKNFSDLKKKDRIDVKVTPVNPDTGEEIPESTLPSSIRWGIDYEVDDKSIKHIDGRELRDISVEEGKNAIIAQMQIASLAPVIRAEEFTVKKPVVYGLTVNQPDKVEYRRTRLGPRGVKDPVTFSVTLDGVPATRKQISKKALEVEDVTITPHKDYKGLLKLLLKLSKKDASFALKQNGDGSFTLYPRRANLRAYLIQPGNYTVTVKLKGHDKVKAEGTVSIRAHLSDWIDLFILIIILLVLAYLIYLIFFKPKFSGEVIHFEAFRADEDMPGAGVRVVPMSASAHLHKITGITHPRRSMVRPGGMKNIPFFAADRTGGVYITKSTIESFDGFGVTAIDPEDSFDAVLASLSERGSVRVPEKRDLSSAPFYLYDETYLYQIKVR